MQKGIIYTVTWDDGNEVKERNLKFLKEINGRLYFLTTENYPSMKKDVMINGNKIISIISI